MTAPNGAIPSEETKTAFSILPVQFPNDDEKIKTKEFLEASSGTVTLVEKFGKVFSPVIYDMNGNIKKLTNKYEEDKEKYEYLEEMILNEKEEGKIIATDALMWLRRALHFLSSFFQSVVDDTLSERCSSDLTPFIKHAYSETLEPHHGWLGTQLFNVLSRFTPNRTNLLYMLALERHNRDDNVIRDMQAYTEKMMGSVRRLIEFYKENNLESFSNT